MKVKRMKEKAKEILDVVTYREEDLTVNVNTEPLYTSVVASSSIVRVEIFYDKHSKKYRILEKEPGGNKTRKVLQCGIEDIDLIDIIILGLQIASNLRQ